MRHNLHQGSLQSRLCGRQTPPDYTKARCSRVCVEDKLYLITPRLVTVASVWKTNSNWWENGDCRITSFLLINWWSRGQELEALWRSSWRTRFRELLQLLRSPSASRPLQSSHLGQRVLHRVVQTSYAQHVLRFPPLYSSMLTPVENAATSAAIG